MKASQNLFAIILPLVLAAFALTGCKDQEGMAVTENKSAEPPAVPVSMGVVNPVCIQDVIY